MIKERSPPSEKASNLIETKQRWEQYKLPDDMKDKTFLDVGCWAGGFCVEAKRRGASKVLGIDMIKSDFIDKFQKEYDFQFLQCDIFSEKFLEIPSFDIVFCSNVLYHVENVISLLFRLKNKVIEKLVLVTALQEDDRLSQTPILFFMPEKSMAENYSNWWVPNKYCLEKILETCEFTNIQEVFMNKNGTRACFHAVPKNELCKKILPRKDEFV